MERQDWSISNIGLNFSYCSILSLAYTIIKCITILNLRNSGNLLFSRAQQKKKFHRIYGNPNRVTRNCCIMGASNPARAVACRVARSLPFSLRKENPFPSRVCGKKPSFSVFREPCFYSEHSQITGVKVGSLGWPKNWETFILARYLCNFIICKFEKQEHR